MSTVPSIAWMPQATERIPLLLSLNAVPFNCSSRRREDMKARHGEELRKFDVDAIQGSKQAIV